MCSGEAVVPGGGARRAAAEVAYGAYRISAERFAANGRVGVCCTCVAHSVMCQALHGDELVYLKQRASAAAC